MVGQVDLVMNALDLVLTSVVKQIVTNVSEELFDSTPIDTRFATSNWIPSINKPFEGVVGVRELLDISFNAQKAGLKDVQFNYRFSQGRAYITNNVSYIIKLNAGSSKQAPPAFVQKSISRGLSKLT